MEIDKELLQNIANYLQMRPWREVNSLLVGLSNEVAKETAKEGQKQNPQSSAAETSNMDEEICED